MTAGHFCRFCINLLLCHSSFGLDDDENILMIGVITRPSFPTNRCPFWTTLDRRKNLFSSSSKFSTKSVKYFSSELKQDKQNRAHRCNLITRCFDAKLVFSAAVVLWPIVFPVLLCGYPYSGHHRKCVRIPASLWPLPGMSSQHQYTRSH